MLQKLPMGRMTALVTTRPTNQLSSTLKIDFKKSSCEPEDLDTQAQLSPLGFAGEHSAKGDDDVKVGSGGFDSSSVDPEWLRIAHYTLTRGAFDIFQGAQSPDKAWIRTLPHNRASGLNEKSSHRGFLYYKDGTR